MLVLVAISAGRCRPCVCTNPASRTRAIVPDASKLKRPPRSACRSATAPVAENPPGSAGISGLGLRQNPEGAVVVRVLPGPFAGDGFKSPSIWRGDLIVSMNGQSLDVAWLRAAAEIPGAGDTLRVVYRRGSSADPYSAVPHGDPDGEERTIEIVLGRCRHMEQQHRPGTVRPATSFLPQRQVSSKISFSPRLRISGCAARPAEWTRCSQICPRRSRRSSLPARCLRSFRRSSVRFRSIASRPTSHRRFARSPSPNLCSRLFSRFIDSYLQHPRSSGPSGAARHRCQAGGRKTRLRAARRQSSEGDAPRQRGAGSGTSAVLGVDARRP